jgi:hypothetical protein
LLLSIAKGVDGEHMIGTRHTFASYFVLAVDTILKVLWREGYARGPQELVTLTYNRVRRLERRFNALVARWRAGTLRSVVSRQWSVRRLPPTPIGPLCGPIPLKGGGKRRGGRFRGGGRGSCDCWRR